MRELKFGLSFRRDYLVYLRIGSWSMRLREPDSMLDTEFSLSRIFCMEILNVLQSAPIYALLGSEYEGELGEGFKLEEFVGEERTHACEAARCYRELLDTLVDQDIARI